MANMVSNKEEAFRDIIREKLNILVDGFSVQVRVSKDVKAIGAWMAVRPLVGIQINKLTAHEALQIFDQVQTFVKEVRDAFKRDTDPDI